MTNLFNQIANDFVFALAWTLIHSVWQFAIVALLFLGLRRFIKNAALNYQLALGSLLVCLLISLGTFYHYYSNVLDLRQLFDLTLWNLDNQNSTDFLQNTIVFFNNNIHLIIGLWIAGFFIHLSRTILDYMGCRNLIKFQSIDLDKQWQTKFINLQQLMGINKKISYKLSQLINSPCVVGVFKPVILIPPALLLNLSPAQIEAVMLHELAHVKRNDYLINILQCIAKGVFFFNPFFIYLSKIIDQERENSCDDIAVYYCGNAMEYSKGISKLAELNFANRLTLAAKSKPYSILPRIKRLFGDYSAEKNTSFQLLCSTLIGILGLILATNVYALPAQPLADTKLEMSQTNVLQPESSPKALIAESTPDSLAEPTKEEPSSSIVTSAVIDYVQTTGKKDLSDSSKGTKKPEVVKKAEQNTDVKPQEIVKVEEPAQVETSKDVVEEKPFNSNFDQFFVWKDSHFSKFFLNKNVDFSQYDSVILFPTTFDRLKISEKTKESVAKSWMKTSFKEMDKFCEHFDLAATRKFNKSQHFKMTNKGGNNVLAIEIRMTEILPLSASKRFPKVGFLGLQAVIANAKTGELVAVVEEKTNLSGFYSNQGVSYIGGNSAISGNGSFTAVAVGGGGGSAALAWNHAAVLFADKLHKDLKRLKQDIYFPIVTVAHNYPHSAISRGMEGSCTVEFVVTETGTTRDIVPIPELCVDKNTGRPTTMWNRASVKAVSKFKYKPKAQDGKSVEVPGVRYKLSWLMARG